MISIRHERKHKREDKRKQWHNQIFLKQKCEQCVLVC